MDSEDLHGRRARRAEKLRAAFTNDAERQLSEMDKDRDNGRTPSGERFTAARLRREIEGLAPSISEGLWRAVAAFEKFEKFDDSFKGPHARSNDAGHEIQTAIERVTADMRNAMTVLEEANVATFYRRMPLLGRQESKIEESREARARENWELLLRDTPPDNQGPENEAREYFLGEMASRRLLDRTQEKLDA
jgi:hypothetical protein